MQLEGMDALKRAVKDAPVELRKWSSDAIRETTFNVADQMRRYVPVHEGHLLRAIEAAVPVRTGLNGRVLIGAGGFHWRFVEYGTRFMPARPFIRPAAEHQAGPYVNRFHEIARRLERFWGS